MEQVMKEMYDTREELVNFSQTNRKYTLGYFLGKTFSKDTYQENTGFIDNLSICSYYTNNYVESLRLTTFLLENRELDNNLRKRIQNNRQFSVEKVKDNYIEYPNTIVSKITQQQNTSSKDKCKIIFTITTCKRLDLFCITMNSFLNCCLDLDLIDRWICIDDNSAEVDRKKMIELYPFFKFIFKDISDKGHIRSMNILRKEALTSGAKYIFHCEDDWKFFYPNNYMNYALEILSENATIGQVLINRNYGEIAKDINTVGGFIEKTSKNRYYIRHEHYTTQNELNTFYDANPGSSHAYWPHFSLRPGMWRAEILTKIGEYNESATHFEQEYAFRYRALGYKTAFLPTIYNLHIGRLTSERFDKDKKNAYGLNDEQQFGEKKKDEKLDVTFTITTCKRLAHFIKTMNDFLLKCEDKHKIKHWICIDDNSSDTERKVMKQTFPFFDFIYKNIDSKGHAKSMNILLDVIKTKYVIQYEDDWLIENSFKIEPLVRLLEEKSNTIQVKFLNEHETKLYRNKASDVCPVEPYNPLIKYKLTEMFHEEQLQLALTNKSPYYDDLLNKRWNNDPYWWPGFTLNPSVYNVELMRKIGKFYEGKEFEFYHGVRIFFAGYNVYVLCTNRCLHIGDDISAYDINKENRYDVSDLLKVMSNIDSVNDVVELKKIKFDLDMKYTKHDPFLNKIYSKISNRLISIYSKNVNSASFNTVFEKIYYINLARRTDLKNKIESHLTDFSITAERFDAIDGKILNNDHIIQTYPEIIDPLFMQTSTLGAAGCLISHHKLMTKIVQEHNENAWILILEDDVEFHPIFKQYPFIIDIYMTMLPASANFVKLTTSCFKHPNDYKLPVNDYIYKLKTDKDFWSAAAYAIRIPHIKKLQQKFPTKYPMDVLHLQFSNEVYYCEPINDKLWNINTDRMFYFEMSDGLYIMYNGLCCPKQTIKFSETTHNFTYLLYKILLICLDKNYDEVRNQLKLIPIDNLDDVSKYILSFIHNLLPEHLTAIQSVDHSIKIKAVDVLDKLCQEYQNFNNVDKSNKLLQLRSKIYGEPNIPNIIHFIYISGKRDFGFINLLAVLSAHYVQKPDVIYMYNNSEPINNKYWDIAKKFVKLVQIESITNFKGVEINYPQYQADIIRLQKLYENGGIYLDLDIITLKSYDKFRYSNCVLGGECYTDNVESLNSTDIEKIKSISNAVILTAAHQKFIEDWLNNIPDAIKNNGWAHHAVVLPRDLYIKDNKIFDLQSVETFIPFCFRRPYIFDEITENSMNKLKNSHSIHLWETIWGEQYLKNINIEYIKTKNTLFSALVKKYVPIIERYL